MNKLFHILICLILMMTTAACTRMPADYSQVGSTRVNSQTLSSDVLQLVATATIGVTRIYVDPVTGLTSEVTVHSEYFSANGRDCRSFSQQISNVAIPIKKLGCKDQRQGWLEIPIGTFVDQ